MQPLLPPMPQHWPMLGRAGRRLALIAALLLLWRWYRPDARLGLLAAVTSGAFEYLQDVLVPDGQGMMLHVDFLLLTSRGAMVIDMRDIAGNIFGGDQMTDWTVMHRSARFTFGNPQARCMTSAVRRAGAGAASRRAHRVRDARPFPQGTAIAHPDAGIVAAEYPSRSSVDGAAAEALAAEWQSIGNACVKSSLVNPRLRSEWRVSAGELPALPPGRKAACRGGGMAGAFLQ
jgi:hypothetical protein